MTTRETSPNYVAQAIEQALAQVREDLPFERNPDTLAELQAKEAQLSSFLDYSTPSLTTLDVADEAHARIDALIEHTAAEIGKLDAIAHASANPQYIQQALARFHAADKASRQ